MWGSRSQQWAARVAATAACGGLLLLAVPAHAAPSGHPNAPRATHAPQQGIPINLQIGGLGVHIVLPVNLGILGGRSTPAPPPKTTSSPAPSSPPATSHRPSPPSRTHQNPPPSRTTHPRPPAGTSQAAAPFAAAAHRPRHTHQSHPSRHTAKHHPKASHARHRDVAASLLKNPPLRGGNVALLLAVIGVFGLGVLAIVLAGGRRREPGPKHRR